MNKVTAASLVMFSLIISTAANAVNFIPTGLKKGDMYRLIFTTRDTLDSTTLDLRSPTIINTYNNFAKEQAEEVDELKDFEWLSLASSPDVDAWDNASVNPIKNGEGVPIYLVTPNDTPNILVANNYVDFWDGTIHSPINLDQEGMLETRTMVFPVPGSNPPEFFFIPGSNQEFLDPNVYLRDPLLNPDNVPDFGVYAISQKITVGEDVFVSTPETQSILSFITIGALILRIKKEAKDV
jgi:hypothetical protein